MTPEIIAIVTVGVALAGVILTSIRGVRQDMARLESRLDGKIDALSAHLDERADDSKCAGVRAQGIGQFRTPPRIDQPDHHAGPFLSSSIRCVDRSWRSPESNLSGRTL